MHTCNTNYAIGWAVFVVIVAIGVGRVNAEPPAVGTVARGKEAAKLSPADLKWFFSCVTSNSQATPNRLVRDAMLEELGKVQVAAGDFDGAKATSKEVSDYAAKSRLAGALAATQSARGDVLGAEATVRELAILPGDDDFRLSLATVKAGLGDFAGARMEARKINYKVSRADAYLKICRMSHDQKDLDAAMSLLTGKLGHLGPQVVEAQALTGYASLAEKTTQGLADPHDRAEARWRIARSQVINGDLNGATETAAHINDDYMLQHEQALVMIAEAQAESGDANSVKSTFERAKWSMRRFDANALIAFAETRSGNLAAAKAVANAQRSRGLVTPVCFAYGMIAAALLENGHVEAARKILNESQELIESFQGKDDKAEGAMNVLKGAVNGRTAIEEQGYVVF